eukprot:1183521-Prorocentrum_minimum.AAC.3
MQSIVSSGVFRGTLEYSSEAQMKWRHVEKHMKPITELAIFCDKLSNKSRALTPLSAEPRNSSPAQALCIVYFQTLPKLANEDAQGLGCK